jgi:hypothetical protein
METATDDNNDQSGLETPVEEVAVRECGLYITTLRKSKKPYLVAITPEGYDVAIAQLLVPEDEFWTLVGDALGLDFEDAPTEVQNEK